MEGSNRPSKEIGLDRPFLSYRVHHRRCNRSSRGDNVSRSRHRHAFDRVLGRTGNYSWFVMHRIPSFQYPKTDQGDITAVIVVCLASFRTLFSRPDRPFRPLQGNRNDLEVRPLKQYVRANRQDNLLSQDDSVQTPYSSAA